ncbi:unnamed protein product [Ascophyllum nodosum]
MSEAASEDASDIEEEVRDFSRRFSRLVMNRAFREDGAATESGPRAGGVGNTVGNTHVGGTPLGASALALSTFEAELSLRGSQRLGTQLQDDADTLRSRVLPSLRENARKLHALYVAIDRMAKEVMPEMEDSVKRMEKAVYDLEEMRKEQVDTRGPRGSYGLGLALGAGLWATRARESDICIPEVFDTHKLFRVDEGGLATPL